MNIILETDSVRLRALEPEDIDVLYKWENDTRIWKMSNTVAPFSKYVLPDSSKTRSTTFTRPSSCA